MEEKIPVDVEKTSRRSWIILFGMALGYLAWSAVLYFGIGDKGTPAWDFSVVGDIPGESPYSTARGRDFSGLVPEPMHDVRVPEQHVNEYQGQPLATGVQRR